MVYRGIVGNSVKFQPNSFPLLRFITRQLPYRSVLIRTFKSRSLNSLSRLLTLQDYYISKYGGTFTNHL